LRATALSKGSLFRKDSFAAVFLPAGGLRISIADPPGKRFQLKDTRKKYSKNEVPARGRDFHAIVTTEEKLGRTTLTITIVLVFVGFVLAALLLLSGLAGLVLVLLAALALSGLVTLLLILFLHIVCHKFVLLEKREPTALLRFKRLSARLVAAIVCKGWDGMCRGMFSELKLSYGECGQLVWVGHVCPMFFKSFFLAIILDSRKANVPLRKARTR
jgi:hypothetical protein